LLRRSPVAPAASYFRLLDAQAATVDAWTTEYLHVLPPAKDGVHPVVAWTKGTALTPFLAALDGEAQQAFLADYSARIAIAYPALPDGRVLFAFRRVFIIASRATR
jgi:trans-aconitate 2-methyltransferase